MKPRFIVAILLILVVLAMALVAFVPRTAPVVPAQPTVPMVKPAPAFNRPTAALAGYATWPVTRQRQALADLERAPAIDPETTRFLLYIVKDRNEKANARNLAANALTAPGRWVGGLAAVFIEQARDSSEDPMWRDYALQHAATVAGRGEDTDLVVDGLRQTALANGPSVGTALLMLQRIEQAGRSPLDPAVLDAVASRAFAAPESDINTTITVLGVIGERRDRSRIVGVRAMLAATIPAVRRAACGALGLIGQPDDAGALAPVLSDSDDSVVAAASIARDRLARRQPQ